MATSQNIIDAATSLIRVRTSGVTFSTDDSNKNTDVFTALKNLINEYGEDGLLAIPAPSSLSATLDIPNGAVRAGEFNLAVDISPQFGIDPSPVVAAVAADTKERLEADITLDISVDMSDLRFTHGKYNVTDDVL